MENKPHKRFFGLWDAKLTKNKKIKKKMDADTRLRPGMHVIIRAFDDVPEHTFVIHSIEDGHITGMALTGVLQGQYGEPDNKLILRVLKSFTSSKASAPPLEEEEDNSLSYNECLQPSPLAEQEQKQEEEEEEEEEEVENWTCHVCTLLNLMTTTTCVVCGAATESVDALERATSSVIEEEHSNIRAAAEERQRLIPVLLSLHDLYLSHDLSSSSSTSNSNQIKKFSVRSVVRWIMTQPPSTVTSSSSSSSSSSSIQVTNEKDAISLLQELIHCDLLHISCKGRNKCEMFIVVCFSCISYGS